MNVKNIPESVTHSLGLTRFLLVKGRVFISVGTMNFPARGEVQWTSSSARLPALRGDSELSQKST